MITTTSAKQDPVQRARQVYEQEECARSFGEDFILHWNNPHAIVYKDAASLAFVRPVNISDPYEKLTNPGYSTDFPNCWWVYLFVGDFKKLVTYLPPYFEFIGWERNNSPRFYKINHLLKWTSKDLTTTAIFSDQMGK